MILIPESDGQGENLIFVPRLFPQQYLSAYGISRLSATR